MKKTTKKKKNDYVIYINNNKNDELINQIQKIMKLIENEGAILFLDNVDEFININTLNKSISKYENQILTFEYFIREYDNLGVQINFTKTEQQIIQWFITSAIYLLTINKINFYIRNR